MPLSGPLSGKSKDWPERLIDGSGFFIYPCKDKEDEKEKCICEKKPGNMLPGFRFIPSFIKLKLSRFGFSSQYLVVERNLRFAIYLRF